ncbi:hypothetical protein BC829DRAFT_47861 [Chytridium lagenaria]|nr:hypothetical protein BC829DRAFT_47861 [Chytridium lagenaria]
MFQPANTRILFNQFLFLITGMANTLGAQWLKYQHAAEALSFLTLLSQYLGMFLVVLLPTPVPVKSTGNLVERVKERMGAFGEVSRGGVMAVAAFDVVGNMVLAAGLFLTGSGLYMVIYSSIIVFTALGNRVLLKKVISRRQWVAVVVITVGLSITAIGNHAKGHNVALGILVSLLGTWIHSMVYILNEHLMSNPATASPPRAQCIHVGLYSTLLTLFAILLISIPTLLTMPLLQPSVIAVYTLLIIASLGHSISYFDLVESTGGVATGVIQALRAVGVFGLSHVWYCGAHEEQCYSTWKGVATVVVVVGVVGFAVAKSLDGGKGGGEGYDEVALGDFGEEEEEEEEGEGELVEVRVKEVGEKGDVGSPMKRAVTPQDDEDDSIFEL